MTTGETIALTRQTFVGKVMSLLFNMLSRLVITFLPRSKYLLISWLQSPSAVILEPKNIKSATVSPSISHGVMGPVALILVFWKLSLLQLPSRDGSLSLALLSLFLSFIFCPTSLRRQWAAFLGVWCPLLLIRSCFVKFAQCLIVLSMNL